jgi:hypothetical protein
MTPKEVLLYELIEQSHPVRVEDVIFEALKIYAQTQPAGEIFGLVAYSISEDMRVASQNEPPVDVLS